VEVGCVPGIKISGQGSSRDEAIADAEKAIDRALAPKKRRLKRD
jgi:predicted RNase H-like HicB family nuclease